MGWAVCDMARSDHDLGKIRPIGRHRAICHKAPGAVGVDHGGDDLFAKDRQRGRLLRGGPAGLVQLRRVQGADANAKPGNAGAAKGSMPTCVRRSPQYQDVSYAAFAPRGSGSWHGRPRAFCVLRRAVMATCGLLHATSRPTALPVRRQPLQLRLAPLRPRRGSPTHGVLFNRSAAASKLERTTSRRNARQERNRCTHRTFCVKA